MGNEQAQHRIAEITQQALQLTQEVMTLHAAWMEAVKRQTAAESYETEAAAAAKRQQFEQLLNRSFDLAEQSDLQAAAYAKTLDERAAVLIEAQGLCETPEQRARVTQLLSRQATTLQAGFFGLKKYIEEAWFGYARDYNTLANYTRDRLQRWASSPAEPPALPAPAVKERVN
jgi:hypothetical protein